MSDSPYYDYVMGKAGAHTGPWSAVGAADAQAERIRNSNNGGGGGGNGGGSCLAGSSPILTPQGWIEIAKLDKDDVVLSYSFEEMDLLPRKIIKKKTFQPKQIWTIDTVEEDTPIRATQAHSFMVSSRWHTTRSLRPGSILSSVDECGRLYENSVVSVKKTNTYEPVYNLVTAGENTFIVRGAITHNFTYFRGLRCWLSEKMPEWRSAEDDWGTSVVPSA